MAFTNYSYAPGLAILGQAVQDINKRAEKAADDEKWSGIADRLVGGATATPDASAPMQLGQMTAPTAAGGAPDAPAAPMKPTFAGGQTAMRMPADPEIENRFISTLKAGGLTNPNGLAAVAAYANAESGYSPNNITGSWADPSQSGQPGTSGGILSWRGPRLDAMRKMTAGADDPVAAQAKFLLVENPDLTVALQNAKSPEEAHSLMANAWRFAGFDHPGGENARRLAMTQAYLGRVAGGAPAAVQTAQADAPAPALAAPDAPPAASPAPIKVASADPNFVPQTGAPVSPALDPGSLYRLTEGAKVNPNAPATAYLSPNAVTANPAAYRNADGSWKTAGEVVASLPANRAPAAAGAPSGVPVQTATGGGPAAAEAPVRVPGYDGTWTRASIAAAAAKDPTREGIPEDDEFNAAARPAGGAPAAGPAAGATSVAPTAPVPVQTAQAGPAAAPGPMTAEAAQAVGLPAKAQAGTQLPVAARPVASAEVRQTIGLMLRDPSTRAAGLQALMSLQTKQAASAPFEYRGGLFQYGSDGTLHQVIAPKESYRQERDADGTIWNVNSNGQKTVAKAATTDDGEKISLQTKAREAEAVRMGLDPKTPAGQRYVLTGQLPSDAAGARDNFVQVPISEDAYGNKIMGRMRKSDGALFDNVGNLLGKPGAAPGGAPAAATAAPAAPAADPVQDGIKRGLTGDAFLQTLPPEMSGQVRAIVEGRAPYPSAMLLAKPIGQKLAQAVQQADPTFEVANATTRAKVRAEFNSGGPNSVAGAITAGNTAMEHLHHLSDAAEEMGNGSLPGVNWLKNKVGTATGGAIPVREFQSYRDKYVEEATKFYRGTGGTEADLQRDIDNLNAASSPEQLRAAIQANVKLMQGKVDALQDRWHQGMGPLVEDFPVIHPKAQRAIDTITMRAQIGKGPVKVPAGMSPDDLIKALPPGTPVALPDGTLGTVPTPKS